MKTYTLHPRTKLTLLAPKASKPRPTTKTTSPAATLPASPAPVPSPNATNGAPAAAALQLTKKFQAALSKVLRPGEEAPLVHISIDRDKAGGHVFAAFGLGHAHDLGKRSVEEFYQLISHLTAHELKLIVVQESCGFGYAMQRTLAAMPGVESLIVHCQPLSGKRKTDRMDARQLCLRLQQYSSGNHDALRPIRVPTPEQVRQRSEVTLRGQALGSIGRLQRQGWSLMQQHDVHDIPPRWWTRIGWPKVRRRLAEQPDSAWLLTMLEPIRAIILQLRNWQISMERLLLPDCIPSAAHDDDDQEEGQDNAPEGKQEDQEASEDSTPVDKRPTAKSLTDDTSKAPFNASSIATPHGMGELTRAILDRRIGDWHRFKNRKQAGSFIGACPGEYSSGGVQQQGGKIDRRGDPHLRALMTELVWRLRRFQPQWRGFVKFAAILGPESKAGRPARKKAITACVRLLFIDLWRLFTGQLKASDIGLN